MTFSSVLTILTDSLIALTLIYCIVLERRIRAFRRQEQSFRSLISDVSESTRLAQGAVSSLRHLMDEISKANISSVKPVFSDPSHSDLRIEREDLTGRFGSTNNTIGSLAARVAALRKR
jgi:hypothetical protein